MDSSLPFHTSSAAPGDFDFLIGDWRVAHRRLNSRLTGCAEWTDFEGVIATRHTLGGFGNIEDHVLHFPDRMSRAFAMRTFNAATGFWTIWWVDGRQPDYLAPPVVGQFSGATGHFYGDAELDGRAIRVRFIWQKNMGASPHWEQAFSADGGTAWETNWTMDFLPLAS
ncbi:MAG: DUF1579 domain-containing protein [Beijerinckiaceae bacterium]